MNSTIDYTEKTVVDLSDNIQEWIDIAMPLIVADKKEEFMQLILNNSDSKIIKATIEVMCGLKAGLPLLDAKISAIKNIRLEIREVDEPLLINYVKKYMEGASKYFEESVNKEPVGSLEVPNIDYGENLKTVVLENIENGQDFLWDLEPMSGEYSLGTKNDYLRALSVIIALKNGSSFEEVDNIVKYYANRKNIRHIVAMYLPGIGNEYEETMNSKYDEEIVHKL